MNIKKTLLLALPILGVAVGGLVAFNSKSASVAEAADYSTSAKDFKLGTDKKSVSATFTVSNSDLEMKGWLLCLLINKPAYDLDSRKLVGSDNYHPYLEDNCAHYFFSESIQKDGKISITWAANSADQKGELWGETTSDSENLAKYMTDANDYHIVVGPRHYEGTWRTSDDIGAGKDHIWENCDYYVGKKSSLLQGVDGQTYLDLSQFPNWKDADDKFAFYYWNGKNNGWSEFATLVDSTKSIYVAQYSLDFVPTGMKAVRIASSAETPSFDVRHNEGKDEVFEEYGVIGITDWNVSWSNGLAGIKFSEDNVEDNVVVLDHYQRNIFSNSENFNKFVSLSEGDEFVIDFDSNTYNTFSTYEALANNYFEINEDDKIEVLKGGIYSLYFDTTSHSLYITSYLMDELDKWCKGFLGENRTCEETISNWSDARSEYDKHLSKVDGATEYLRSVEHVSHDAKIEGYIALAMQRYDFLVSSFEGYTDYLGRCDSQHFSPYQSGALVISNGEDDTSMMVIVVAAVSLLAFTTLLVIKKRKSIR